MDQHNTNELYFLSWRRKEFQDRRLLAYEAQKSKEFDLSARQRVSPTTQLLIQPMPLRCLMANWRVQIILSNSNHSTASANYKGRYVVSGSYRRDGSSRFSENNRYGKFLVRWRCVNVDQEKFFSWDKVVSNLKSELIWKNRECSMVTMLDKLSDTVPNYNGQLGEHLWNETQISPGREIHN